MFVRGHTPAAIQDRLPVVVVVDLLIPEAILHTLVLHQAPHHHLLLVPHPAHRGLGGDVHTLQHSEGQDLTLDLHIGEG